MKSLMVILVCALVATGGALGFACVERTKLCENLAQMTESRDALAARVALNGRTNVFERPLVLDASREWFIVGPGVLDATLVASMNGVVVHLKNCVVINRSDVPVESANIRYVFDRGVYLNFTRAEECPREVFATCFENYDAAFSDIRFGGPETIRGYDRLRRRERQDLLRRATHSSSRNFTFPRWIFPARGKYRGETVSDFRERFPAPLSEHYSCGRMKG